MDPILNKWFNGQIWLSHLVVLGACLVFGLVVRWLIFRTLGWYQRKKPSVLKEQLLKQLKPPTVFLLPLLFAYSSFTILKVTVFWNRFTEILIIIGFTWLLMVSLRAVEEVVKEKFKINGLHMAKERRALTQLRFLKSMAMVIIITIAIASILWNIPAVREVGKTILTSAGVVGIIIGVAAQKSIANLVTGFQLAFTQTIKIDDEVVIEGEFGSVEDITLTYVVVRTWDWRRLVLPLNYFNDKPFVNWTFNSRPLLASVYLRVDYIFPVNELRTKLTEILRENKMWDQRIAEVEVTDTGSRDMTLRASFSVRNATHSWKLSCLVREELIAFIKEEHPTALPKLRRTEAGEVV